MLIRACVFDLFGTLVPIVRREEYYAGLLSLAKRMEVSEAAFLAEWDRTYLARNIGGYEDLQENVLDIAGRLGVRLDAETLHVGLDEFRDMVGQALAPKAEADEVLSTLKSLGYKLGLISNCHNEVPDSFRAGQLGGYFDAMTFSSEIGMMKPTPKIYQETARRLEVEPGECLYVGDGHGKELAGANGEGMLTVMVEYHVDDGFVWSRDEAADFTVRDLRELFPILEELKEHPDGSPAR